MKGPRWSQTVTSHLNGRIQGMPGGGHRADVPGPVSPAANQHMARVVRARKPDGRPLDTAIAFAGMDGKCTASGDTSVPSAMYGNLPGGGTASGHLAARAADLATFELPHGEQRVL